MSLRTRFACICFVCFGVLLPLQAQTGASSSTTTVQVPRLIRLSGMLTPGSGLTGDHSVVGVTFSLYAEQTGGAPLWQETQSVELDSVGHYTVLLGSTQAEGLPAELFTSVQAQWLGVQAEREAEQARIMLVSVPFALKAGDAETLGGKPPSAYAAAPPAATTWARVQLRAPVQRQVQLRRRVRRRRQPRVRLTQPSPGKERVITFPSG